MASTLRMRTTISPGQWQPWAAVSPLLGLIRRICHADMVVRMRKVLAYRVVNRVVNRGVGTCASVQLLGIV